MLYRPTTPFPAAEAAKLDQQEELFCKIHRRFGEAEKSLLPKHAAEDLVSDGFYPHYFNQAKRILFIGRESRDISGCNYIDVLLPAYQKGKRIGRQHLNTNHFHSRMLYVAFGIVTGMPLWRDIPVASEIGNTFGTPRGLSFAFMNLSKLTNEAEHWSCDWNTFETAVTLTAQGPNLIEEQIALLEPQVVILMNLAGKLHTLGETIPIRQSEPASSYWLQSKGHRSLLIDTFHFSARRGSGRTLDGDTDFYIPICEEIRKSEAMPALS